MIKELFLSKISLVLRWYKVNPSPPTIMDKIWGILIYIMYILAIVLLLLFIISVIIRFIKRKRR